MEINTVIFDLGGVLIDWNPRYVYRTIFKTEEEIDWFFENVATHDWNENQDAGYPIAKATEELVAQHPEWENEIKAYYGRWTEMLGGPINGTVEIFRQLKEDPDLKFYQAVFIDDNLRNIKAAEELGINGIHFHNPLQLKKELTDLGLFAIKG